MGKARRSRDLEFGRTLSEFEAAKESRRTDGWWASNSGPNSDLRQAWYWLVKRHQDLVDNDAYASRAVGVIVNNWIGDGVMSTPTGATKRYNQLWKRWCDTPLSDFYGERQPVGQGFLTPRSWAALAEVMAPPPPKAPPRAARPPP